jgi:tRNA threonylcarbamoyl adenosine modification protein YeaZ
LNNTLALERSAPPGSLALHDGGRMVLTRAFAATAPRAPEWVAVLGAELAAAGAAPAALARLIVGIGPGSFSGIRAAIAVAQGLALPRGLPVLGLSSAAALARRVARARECETVAVIGDARRQRFWLAVYRLEHAGRLLLAATGAAPTHTSADFALSGYAELAAALPTGAPVVALEGVRLAAELERRGTDLALLPDIPPVTAADLVELWLCDRTAARRDPLPVYLHPAVASAS